VEVLEAAIEKGASGILAGRFHFRLAGLNAVKRQEQTAYDHLKAAIEMDPGYAVAAKADLRLKKIIKKAKFKKLLATVATQ